MTNIACPICNGATLVRGEGKLEQSGDSYLPTVVWSCGCCGYARFEPALGRKWRAADELVAASTMAPSIASAPAPEAPPGLRPAVVARSRRAA